MDARTEYQSLGARTSISISVYGGVHVLVLVCMEYHIDRSCTYCLRVRAIVSVLYVHHCGGGWRFIEDCLVYAESDTCSSAHNGKSSLRAIH